MKHLFVPYELALMLKEKGFNEKVLYTVYLETINNRKESVYSGHQMEWVDWNNFISDVAPHLGKCFISAPLYQQVIDWFREKGIEIDVWRYTYSGGKYQGKVYMWTVNQYDEKYDHELEENPDYWILNERESKGFDFKNPYDAYNKAIEEALKLI